MFIRVYILVCVCVCVQHQQQVAAAVERAKQVTMQELNAIIGVILSLKSLMLNILSVAACVRMLSFSSRFIIITFIFLLIILSLLASSVLVNDNIENSSHCHELFVLLIMLIRTYRHGGLAAIVHMHGDVDIQPRRTVGALEA